MEPFINRLIYNWIFATIRYGAHTKSGLLFSRFGLISDVKHLFGDCFIDFLIHHVNRSSMVLGLGFVLECVLCGLRSPKGAKAPWAACERVSAI